MHCGPQRRIVEHQVRALQVSGARRAGQLSRADRRHRRCPKPDGQGRGGQTRSPSRNGRRAGLTIGKRPGDFRALDRASGRNSGLCGWAPGRPWRNGFCGADAGRRTRSWRKLRKLSPLAPLHQPHNLAADRCAYRARAAYPAGRLLRHGVSPKPARAGSAFCHPARAHRRRGSGATVSTAFHTNISPSD